MNAICSKLGSETAEYICFGFIKIKIVLENFFSFQLLLYIVLKIYILFMYNEAIMTVIFILCNESCNIYIYTNS